MSIRRSIATAMAKDQELFGTRDRAAMADSSARYLVRVWYKTKEPYWKACCQIGKSFSLCVGQFREPEC